MNGINPSFNSIFLSLLHQFDEMITEAVIPPHSLEFNHVELMDYELTIYWTKYIFSKQLDFRLETGDYLKDYLYNVIQFLQKQEGIAPIVLSDSNLITTAIQSSSSRIETVYIKH
ncbi:Hypothetical_protein [Hexamita inflata]|uniref:Hypothetical_protein n=1 Tax=Hexamita inflata TaxID=28002 RepID=A0AA86TU23_9EUKA|nr:Hypothetical protein HINF_LOCUS9678 [Hexamita inflata]